MIYDFGGIMEDRLKRVGLVVENWVGGYWSSLGGKMMIWIKIVVMNMKMKKWV